MDKVLYIIDIPQTGEIIDFFMIKNCAIRQDSNKRSYFDMTLSDKSGEINAKKWNLDEIEANNLAAYKEGDIVKIAASASEWNGIKQLKVSKIRKVNPENDEIDMTAFIKAAPEDPNEMFNYLLEKAEEISDEGLLKLTKAALFENKEKLLFYPGAMRNHHAEFAGLLYHTKRMLDMGIKACLVYTNLDKDWVIAGVILHDLEKINEIQSNELGISNGYTKKGNLLGHIVMGAINMEERAKNAGLSEEKTIMLQHMILSHHYEPEFGSPIKPMFPEAELLHYLDMLDAKMFDFEAALAPIDKGSFTERIRTLDNRMLYKPSFAKE